MATLSITEPCPVHLNHSDSVDVESIEHATALVAVALTTLSYDLFVFCSVLREWMKHDGSETFEIEFLNEYGDVSFLTYAV